MPMRRIRTNPRWFLRYMHWGIYAGVPAPALGVLLGGWPDTEWHVTVALLMGIAGLEVWAWWAVRFLNGRPVARRYRPLLVVSTVLVVLGLALIVALADHSGHALISVGCLLGVAAANFGMLLRLWQASLLGLAVIVAGAGTVVLVLGPTQEAGMLAGIWAVTVPFVGFAWWSTGWMLRVMTDLEEARDLAAAAAVSEERARISRDLHDFFGQTLSAIAVKSELAAELAARGRSEAAAIEMREVHRIADESGGKVRAVVRGERGIDLVAELEGARSLLGAAQVVCQVSADPAAATPDSSVLAWVLREAVTNILRHSAAQQVMIDLANGGDQVELEIANDGVRDDLTVSAGGGIGGMRQRLSDVGGELEVSVADGWFRVAARVPRAEVREEART